MAINLNGINNINEYYTNHYFASIFADNAEETISKWRVEAKENEGVRTPGLGSVTAAGSTMSSTTENSAGAATACSRL
jgi:hypothetical protein